jgi:hypothetical protein
LSFGAGKDDAALRVAWRAFCKQLEAAGDQAFKDHNPGNPLQRADAFRFLTQNLGQAFDLALETKDPKHPQIHTFCGPNRKLGSDAADFLYQQAWIDGATAYRVAGSRGSSRFLNFTVQGPRPEKILGTDWPSLHEPFGDIPEVNLLGHDLKVDDRGNFELFIGGPQREGNWLPTTPGSRKLFVRQGFDRWDEEPARFSIEPVELREPRPLPTPDTMILAMGWAGRFVTGLMNDWPDHPYRYSKGVVDPASVNQFPAQRADESSDRKRGRAAAHLCWQLASDEALIVEFASPNGFWTMTNMGAFFTSMDYLYRPVSTTPSRTSVDADGKVRLILSHDDPGYHNWLDTQGFERGNLTYRNLLGQSATVFETRLVKRSMLDQALPRDSAKVTREQRIAQMRERFDAIRRRFGL